MSDNPAAPSAFEFVPFASPAPPVSPEKQEAVSWFTTVAPNYDLQVNSPTLSTQTGGIGSTQAVHGLRFDDVTEIAENARKLRMAVTPEPAEITQLRAEAQAEAKRILLSADEQAFEVLNLARETGYAEGHAQGFEAGMEEAVRQASADRETERNLFQADINTFLAHIEKERRAVWKSLEPQMIDLVFEMAQKVIKMEVEASRTVALSVVQNCLRRVADSSTLRIRVNPDDLEEIRGHREEILELVDGVPHLEIIGDRRVGIGGAVVETGSGVIDARIDTQTTEIEGTLNDMKRGRDAREISD